MYGKINKKLGKSFHDCYIKFYILVEWICLHGTTVSVKFNRCAMKTFCNWKSAGSNPVFEAFNFSIYFILFISKE